MSGPLRGVRVLDVSTVLAGPLACQILGDFGADVIKIEHPQRGDSLRGHGPSKDGVALWYSMVGRNKRSVGLYLGDPDGAEIFRKIAARADVIVENFRPGTLEKWGVGPDVLKDLNPRLIFIRVTGFGQTGPYANRPGFGTLAESMSGFAAITGEPDGPPTLPPFGLADSIAGISAACAALMALYHRDARGGGGQSVDLAILEPIVTALGPQPIVWDQLGTMQPRTGNRSDNNAPRNTYQTKDGRWVAISTSANSIAERVMRLVGHPEVIEEPWFGSAQGRVAHVDMLDAYVADWIKERTRDDVMESFEAAEAAIAPIYDVAELMEDPHAQAREMFPAVDDPRLGPVRMQNVLYRMSETPGSIQHTGRELGADTDEILKSVGVSAERIAELRERGVVA
jgi:crotonobetainyl-CoA:carnitine CoA-transferase CaiB-like acyl-CoA transferase